jgi:hypothetical protein
LHRPRGTWEEGKEEHNIHDYLFLLLSQRTQRNKTSEVAWMARIYCIRLIWENHVW